MKDVSKALKRDEAEAHFGEGVLLAGKGKHEEAEKEYREAIRLNPDYLGALRNLAVCLDLLGRAREARGHWERALTLEKNPDVGEFIRKRLARSD